MTIDDIHERLAGIKEALPHSEYAHGLEDDLMADVLRAIADESMERPSEAAALVLTSLDLDFERWCA